MRSQTVKKQNIRRRRTMRVRQHMSGTSQKPRMSVNKSNKHILVQLIDDESGTTLGMTATYAKEFQGTEFTKKNKASAAKLGEKIAEIAKENNIVEVVFDRGQFKYHGILAALADSARAAGLQF